MGRPLNKKFFGNRNVGATTTADNGIGGEGITIALTGANNSTGFTNNSLSQVTVTAPDLPNGVQAVIKVHTYTAAGALTNKTTFTKSGTSVAAASTYGTITAPLASTSAGGGSGATFIITKTGTGTTYNSNTTVTLVDSGSGYHLTDTIVVLGSLLGGVDTTNDLTLTVATFVGTTGTIQTLEVTEKGSGYASAPTVTFSTGTKGTLDAIASLTADTGAVSSSTNQENAITAYAWIGNGGGSRQKVDIVKQESSRRYAVRTATLVSGEPWTVRSAILVAKTGGAAADTDGDNTFNEMDITAFDAAGKEYWVLKLTAHKALIKRKASNTDGEFADPTTYPNGQNVAWTMNSTSGTKVYAVQPYLAAGINVKIDNA
jgi:hypothetical protein